MGGGREASAVNLAISPLAVELTARAPVSAVTLGNLGGEPVTFELFVVAWHEGAAAAHPPVAGLIASPPIFTIPPGGEQIARVGLVDPAMPETNEVAFRLLASEVVPTAAPALGQIRIRSVFSLPVFIAPTGTRRIALTTALERRGDTWRIVARNDGNVRVRLIGLGDAARPREPLRPLGRYVLARRTETIELPASPLPFPAQPVLEIDDPVAQAVRREPLAPPR